MMPCRRHLTPHTFRCAKKLPRCHQNCSKRSFFGLNFCLRSKFERIFEKSQIFFRLRAEFRKKKCTKKGSKRVKIGVKKAYFRGFWQNTPFYPILPYFPYFILFRALFPMLRANAAARRPTYSEWRHLWEWRDPNPLTSLNSRSATYRGQATSRAWSWPPTPPPGRKMARRGRFLNAGDLPRPNWGWAGRRNEKNAAKKP